MPGFLEGALSDLDRLVGTEPSDAVIRQTIENYFRIRPKHGHTLVPLRFNAAQEAFWPQRDRQSYLLKFRQLGASTLALAEMFARTIMIPNEYTAIISHRSESSTRLFQIVKTFYRSLPKEFKDRINGDRNNPTTINKRELYFEGLNSRIIVDTAANPDAIRGLTLTGAVCDELAFWPEEVAEDAFSSVLAALVPGGVLRIVTTPDLAGSFAYSLWRHSVSGENGYRAYFQPWWVDPINKITGHGLAEYDLTPEEAELRRTYNLSLDQIAWRRDMISKQRQKFFREYPEDAEACWTNQGRMVFDADRVLSCWDESVGDPRTVDSSLLEPGKRLLIAEADLKRRLSQGHRFVVGADPADGGDFSATQIVDVAVGDQVYASHEKIPLHGFANYLAELGTTFGTALLAVERNNHGHAVLDRLVYDIGYPNIYYALDDKPGIGITAREKAFAIGILDEALWRQAIKLRDFPTYDQLRTYVYDERMRAGAVSGAHDDLVSALLCVSIGLADAQRPGFIRSGSVAIPLPEDVERQALQTASQDAEVWFKTGDGEAPGVYGNLPWTRQVFGLPDQEIVKRLVWTCPSCGSHRINAYTTDSRQTGKEGVARCARCNQPVPWQTYIQTLATFRRMMATN